MQFHANKRIQTRDIVVCVKLSSSELLEVTDNWLTNGYRVRATFSIFSNNTTRHVAQAKLLMSSSRSPGQAFIVSGSIEAVIWPLEYISLDRDHRSPLLLHVSFVYHLDTIKAGKPLPM